MPESSPAFSPCHVRTQRGAVVCKPGRGPHQNPTVPDLDLELPASTTVRNQFLLLKPPGLWGSAMAALADDNRYMGSFNSITQEL